MCYIFSFFAWTLDLIQRVITFALACLMAFAVCSGLAIAIIAGVAYGYNYSQAEWLTFKRSDISVYKRRNQFYDNLDVIFPGSGRRSAEGNDYGYTSSGLQEDIESLSDTWMKAEDTRKYAEKLTKYATQNPIFNENSSEKLSYFKLTRTPVPSLSTSMWQSETSGIIMRKFRPLYDLPVFKNANIREYSSSDKRATIDYKNSADLRIEEMESETPDNKIRVASSTDYTKRFMFMENTYKAPKVLDYPTEDIDVDVDNVVYKPV